MTALLLSRAHRAQIEREAHAAFPGECCGLLEGKVESDAMRVTALHPARNLSSGNNRFEIDPAGHFAAIRAARANGREIIGCYHSHPNGRAEPSTHDADGAWDEGFVWLIAAVTDKVSSEAFRRVGGDWQRLELQEIAEKSACAGFA